MKLTTTPEDGQGPAAPAWIVSYGDMITLLLSIFVLLQAFARTRDAGLFREGRGSFNSALSGLGVPGMLLGSSIGQKDGYPRKFHSTQEDDENITVDRVIDPTDDEIRRVFQELQQSVAVKTANVPEIQGRLAKTFSAPIGFEPSEASLTQEAREYLGELAISLTEGLNQNAVRIYIVGLAAGQGPDEERWVLAARRASAVEDFLRNALSTRAPGRRWSLFSWGAGADDRQRHSPVSTQAKHTFIRITIARES